MSRQYEAVYVFDSTLEDAAINDKLDRFHGLLGTSRARSRSTTGAAASSPTPSGPAKTATTSSPASTPTPTTLPEYERALKLDDGVVRYLVTLHEHEVGAPPMSEEECSRSPRAREEDDEDED